MTGWSRKLKVSSDVFLSQKLKQVQAESNTGKTKGSPGGRQLAGKALTMQWGLEFNTRKHNHTQKIIIIITIIIKPSIVVYACPPALLGASFLGASWPAILAYLTSPKSTGDCLKKTNWMVSEEWQLSSTHMYTQVHSHLCTHAPGHKETDTCTHTQRKHQALSIHC